jgi:ubiquinone/menaquinone biosynthesis C-methylase UbiE
VILKRKIAENLRHPKGFYGHFVSMLMNYFNHGIIRMSVDEIPEDRPVQTIVEVGIGSGKGLQLIAKRFPLASLIGIDISKSMLAKAAKRNKQLIKKLKLNLKLNAIDQMDLDAESVDCLLTINTIYFWDDPDRVCKEVYRVLKPSSSFILSFNPGETMDRAMYPEDLFSLYSQKEVEALLERNAFQVISVKILDDRLEKYCCISAIKV